MTYLVFHATLLSLLRLNVLRSPHLLYIFYFRNLESAFYIPQTCHTSQFFADKNGQDKLVGDEGRDAVSWLDEATPFHLETITRIIECREKQEKGASFEDSLRDFDADMDEIIVTVKKQKRFYHKHSNEQKLAFVYYNRIKLFNAAKFGRLAGSMAERAAQKWPEKLKEDKDRNMSEKQTDSINRAKPQLDERHKVHLLDFYDNWPQARVLDAMESLT
ncbi:hypothetical protein EDC96DRAFT_544993 [Choanephora cucurbitarum]|nr:hypothetical protein EDC96DRAFT_544993 [Choanephora cucurbitarum]